MGESAFWSLTLAVQLDDEMRALSRDLCGAERAVALASCCGPVFRGKVCISLGLLAAAARLARSPRGSSRGGGGRDDDDDQETRHSDRWLLLSNFSALSCVRFRHHTFWFATVKK